ncbi:Neuron navigator 2 [Armadillidium nasatum]|uniref:Neuron navigator 2 n=1 Tax=Armadillidium nasatum TaxID=96803 RepID=A0A5N5SQK6_9CRUS|nr:Neuron navigator 2 [Armadillidium nasatum]
MRVENWKNKQERSSNSSNGNRPVLRGPSPGNANGPYHSAKQKDSMLEKFKLFNNKEKDSKSKNTASAAPDPKDPTAPQRVFVRMSRFSRSSKEGKESSPKSSRRSEDRESSKGSPRSAHRGHRSGDSRDREREKGREKEGKSDVKEGRKADKLTLNLDTGSRCMSSATQVDNSNRTSKMASISSSAKAVQQPKSPTMPQIPSPSSPLSSSGVGTGIPKPTAAVKGTTKSIPDKSSPSSPNVNSPSSNKEYPNKIARNSPAPPIRRTPIGGEAPPTPELRDPKGSLPRQRNLGRREDSNPPSVAMDIGDKIFKQEDSEDVIIDVKPMQPLIRAAQYGYIRGLGGHNGRALPPSLHVSRMALQENSHTVPQKGMRIAPPHLRRHLTPGSPRSPGHIQGHIIDADYSDLECIDLANGYLSDGDVLRSNIGCTTYPPPNMDGYLSEGGASLYAHRLNQRLKEDVVSATEVALLNAINSCNFDRISAALSSADSEATEDASSCGSSRISSSFPLSDAREDESDVNDSNNKNFNDKMGIEGDIYFLRQNTTTKKKERSEATLTEPPRKRRQYQTEDKDFGAIHYILMIAAVLSSGVSDTLNELSEDFLSTSLSTEQTAVLAKAKGLKEVGLKLPVGLSGPSPRKATMGMDPSGAYKVVSSKAHVKKTESSQQTEGQPFKKFDQKKTNFGPAIPSNPSLGQNSGMVNPQVNNSRKTERKTVGGAEKREKILTPSPQVNGDTKKIQNPKTAPSNFGYSKKVGCNSSSSSTGKTVTTSKSKESDPSTNSNGRDSSSHSLDRPRTKLKVSGGTQTTSDLQYMPNTTGFHSDGEYSSNSLGRKYQQIKSYSLNGPAAAQLSQGVRERILQSPYRKVHMSGGEYSPYGQGFYRERSPRLKATDGSLSDNPYSNYAEIQYNSNPYGSPYSWVARNNYAPSVASAPTRPLGGSLTEAESMESLTSSTSSFAAQLQHARATSLTPARLMMHQREMSTSPSPRLARSNSVRSTKSEKVLGLRDGYHSSQPTSPTPPSCSRLPMSPLNTSRGSAYYTPSASRTSKDDECHGSSLSLVSSSSSLYSSQEDKHAHEVRKLKRDLSEAQDKVITLTNQLTTNAHVVAAFEQSLTNMTNRLQQLTATSEQKECELSELRRTIDALRQQSIDAGLTVASLQSMSKELNKIDSKFKNPLGSLTPSKSPAVSIRSKSCLPPSSPASAKPPPHPQQPSNNSNNSTNNVSCSALHVCSSKRTPQSATPEKNGTEFARRHTFTGTCRDLKVSCEGQSNGEMPGGNLVRGTSVESVSSLSSACSGTSHTSNHDKSDNSKLGKKKGWLRSSFTKAFSRNNKNKKLSGGSFSDADDSKQEGEGLSVPSSPLPTRGVTEGEEQQTSEGNSETTEEIELLKRQLWEKDMVLTDIRLEALTSAHQLESLKETINKMRSEMKSLKEDNDRLQRLMASESLASSRSSLPPPDISTDVPPRPLSLTEEVINIDDPTDVLLIDPLDRESKRGTVSVFMGCHGEYEKYMDPSDGSTIQECVIGAISISSKTKWDTLDSLVRRIFKEYLLRVDPSSNLGINSDSIVTYHLGEVTRGRNSPPQELLPCGYLVGEVTNVRITLKGAVINCVDALAFETLIPKSIVQRYISLLTEHRRIILCGPSGTGKTFLAQKLAEFLVCRLGKDPSPGNIATFSVDHKTNKDLGAYLSHVSEQCENNASELPLVIILDNLHYAGALTEVFNGFLSAKYTQCPFIIGTMIQATSCSTTNLQLHHNFRWVLMANHIEPVKGLLAKVSRRKLTHVEVETCTRQPRLQQVLDWLPKCWSHINKFLETHSSSDVTIGPRLFLSCPSSVEGSQVWFADLWNYSMVPYMVEAVREGLQLYGKRASWEDPSTWIQETYPWVQTAHGGAKSLLSMLMRLQEAANFSPQQDTATVSLENMENALESTL